MKTVMRNSMIRELDVIDEIISRLNDVETVLRGIYRPDIIPHVSFSSVLGKSSELDKIVEVSGSFIFPLIQVVGDEQFIYQVGMRVVFDDDAHVTVLRSEEGDLFMKHNELVYRARPADLNTALLLIVNKGPLLDLFSKIVGEPVTDIVNQCNQMAPSLYKDLRYLGSQGRIDVLIGDGFRSVSTVTDERLDISFSVVRYLVHKDDWTYFFLKGFYVNDKKRIPDLLKVTKTRYSDFISLVNRFSEFVTRAPLALSAAYLFSKILEKLEF